MSVFSSSKRFYIFLAFVPTLSFIELKPETKNKERRRMHSSRMRTARFSGRLSCHACPTPLPCTPSYHACPLPCTPSCHACPPCHTHHAHPAATHAPYAHLLPCMSPMHTSCHACPPPWTEWLTDKRKNITFPQLRLRAVTKITLTTRD